jgi:hypothetical protein
MAQRLVDIVDHTDVEHETLQLDGCLHINFLSSVSLARSALEVQSALPVKEFRVVEQASFATSIFSLGNRGLALEIQSQVPGVSLDYRIDGFRRSMVPTTAIEDMTIFTDVPGVYP